MESAVVAVDGLLKLALESQPALVSILLLIFAVLFSSCRHMYKTSCSTRRLPPGSLGLPVIGESVDFLRAQRRNKTQDWFDSRIARYGPVFKTSLIGKPTVVITGPSGNRFLFASNGGAIGNNTPSTVSAIMGRENTFNLGAADHRLIRAAMTSFLKPEVLRTYVAKMDSIIKQQLFQVLDNSDTVEAVPFLKKTTFNVSCSLLFGLPVSEELDALFDDFTTALRGMWCLQINVPGTAFRRAVAARKRIRDCFSRLIRDRRSRLSRGTTVGSEENVVASFVSLRDGNGEFLTEDMLVDNMMTLMIGSHDTTTILLAHFVRLLARDKTIYKCIVEEQERILGEREGKEGTLAWNDIQKMKYTWMVAQELMRIVPPVFGNFKLAVEDTTFGGFDIPKGWQVFWVATTHMDKSIFPEPEKFDPSRFGNASRSYPPYSYIPFGAGLRICPGSEFARAEVLLLIHHLVTNYEWSEMIPDEPITRDPMPYPAMGLPIKLQRKNATHGHHLKEDK